MLRESDRRVANASGSSGHPVWQHAPVHDTAYPVRHGWGSRAARPLPQPMVRAAVLLSGIGLLLLALGIGVDRAGLPSAFDLDAEYRVPSLWSGGLLLGAATATWSLRRSLEGTTTPVAGLFAFMALDEVASIHELLERRVGLDWQVLYLPLIVAGGLGWLLLLRRLAQRSALSAGLWVAGAGAWFASQILEFWEWDGAVRRSHYYMKMYLEEFLEMTGSGYWLLAASVVLLSRGTRDTGQPARLRSHPLRRSSVGGSSSRAPGNASDPSSSAHSG